MFIVINEKLRGVCYCRNCYVLTKTFTFHYWYNWHIIGIRKHVFRLLSITDNDIWLFYVKQKNTRQSLHLPFSIKKRVISLKEVCGSGDVFVELSLLIGMCNNDHHITYLSTSLWENDFGILFSITVTHVACIAVYNNIKHFWTCFHFASWGSCWINVGSDEFKLCTLF